jgi:NO-binding membrane sensor protein with MHYT domain
MLAFHLPVPVQYDWPTVLLSLLAAVLASAVALFVVSRRKMGLLRAFGAGPYVSVTSNDFEDGRTLNRRVERAKQ